MLTAQTAGTQIEPFLFSIKDNSRWLNIRKPASSGMLLRMAYPMAEVYCFATYIASCRQIVNSFSASRF